MKQNWKKNLFSYFIIAACFAVMLYFMITQNGFQELANIVNLRKRWIIFALCAAIAIWLLEGWSYHLLSTHVYEGWKFNYSMSAGLIGMLYSNITPFSTGGQPMQIYNLQKNGMTTGAASAIVVVRCTIYQVALLAFSLVMVVLRLAYFTKISSFAFLLILALVFNFAYVGFLVMTMRSPKATNRVVWFFIRLLAKLHIVKKPEERFDRIHAQLALFHENVARIGHAFKVYLATFFITFVQFVCQCLIPYFLYVAFFYEKAVYNKEDIITIVAAQAFVLMVSYFIPTPGASGGAEISSYGFFSKFYQDVMRGANYSLSHDPGTLQYAGYTPEAIEKVASDKLTSAIFLWRMISFYLTIIVGSVYAAIGNRQKPLQLKNRLFDEESLKERELHKNSEEVFREQKEASKKI